MAEDSLAVAPAAAREAASVIGGRFRIERLLGRGGMGAVYEVTDERTGRRLALKRLLQGGPSKNASALFEKEFHVLAGLAHPSIVSVFDYGIDDEGPFYTMELLDGADVLKPGGGISGEERAQYSETWRVLSEYCTLGGCSTGIFRAEMFA